LDLFKKIPGLDIAFHFVGGIAIGCAFFFSLKYFEKRNYIRLNGFFRILFAICSVSLIIVLWEFYQFVLSTLFPLAGIQPSIEDTIKDLFFGLIGGTIAAVFLETLN
jgi:hypothetical protein